MPPREDTDVHSLDASALVKAAAAAEALSGLFTGLGAVQLLISGEFEGDYRWAQYVVWALGMAGLASVVLAAQVMRMRLARTVTATTVAVLLAPAASVWFAFCVMNSIFSLMQLISLIASWAAAVLLPFALPATQRASVLRKRLSDAGLDLGF